MEKESKKRFKDPVMKKLMRDLYVFLGDVKEGRVRQMQEPVTLKRLWDFVGKDPRFTF